MIVVAERGGVRESIFVQEHDFFIPHVLRGMGYRFPRLTMRQEPNGRTWVDNDFEGYKSPLILGHDTDW